MDQSVSSNAFRGADRLIHVLGGPVGRDAEDLFGGRVDVLERSASPGVDQLARDEKPGLPLYLRMAYLWMAYLRMARLGLAGSAVRPIRAVTHLTSRACRRSFCAEHGRLGRSSYEGGRPLCLTRMSGI